MESIIDKLVATLPEKYQPIFGHPELSEGVSRTCVDRLASILEVHDALERHLGRPLRVLDLGCAQGFFSLNLAEAGANVLGIDYLSANVAVCKALAAERPDLKASFSVGRLEDAIGGLQSDQFDLVLGLSVFHHVIHEKGIATVKQLLNLLAERAGCLLLELALKEEPLYWGSSQPEDPWQLLDEIAFIHQVSLHSTHLGDIQRPLFVASNSFWIIDGQAQPIASWTTEPHHLVPDAHGGGRRYFKSNLYFLKWYRINETCWQYNRIDFEREMAFFEDLPPGFHAPELYSHGASDNETWLVMDRLDGRLLSDLIRDGGEINTSQVIHDVLSQACQLEEVGRYHNDIRTWNTLIREDGSAVLIDYGSIVHVPQDCVWPHNIFLSFLTFLHEVSMRILVPPVPLRTAAMSPGRFPAPYDRLVRRIWAVPLKRWSFALIKQTLENLDNDQNDVVQPGEPWSCAIEEAVDVLCANVHNLGQQLQQAETKVEQLVEAKVQQAEAESRALAAEMKVLQAEAESRAAVAEVKALQAVAEAKALQAVAEAKALQAVTEAKALQAVTEAKALQAVAEAKALQAVAKTEADQILARVADADARAAEANNVVAKLKTELDALHSANHNHWLLAEGRGRELQLIYQSRSWRLTAMLRRMSELRMAARTQMKSVAKIVAVAGVGSVSRFLRHKPRLKGIALGILHRMPTTHRLVHRAWAARRGDPTNAFGSVVVADLADATVVQVPPNQIALPLPKGSRTIYVYVDHTVKCQTNTGVQRVTRGVAHSLIEAGERVRFVKWNADTQQCLLIDAAEREYLAKWNGPAVLEDELNIYPLADEPQTPVLLRPTGENNWLVVPEVTHITFQDRPVTLDLLMWSRRAGLKSGFVFYDAIPMRRPEFREMSGKHAEYMQQLILADVVWPISNWAGEDLKAYWVVNQLATARTMPCIETQHLAGESQTHARATQVTQSESLILCVGTIEPRKNQVQLIRAFQSFCRENPDSGWRLVLVGNLHPAVADDVVQATSADGAIQHLGHVSDQELHELYLSCAFTVFPSVEEGFGLPIIESLWYGRPCLCANFGSMLEVAREGGCLTVDTSAQAELDAGLERLITDTELRLQLSHQALSRPIRSWGDYAKALCGRIEAEGNPVQKIGLTYFWVDATIQFPKNTGIQRVTRQLARALMENGLRLIPVKLDAASGKLVAPDARELEHLARWNGPSVDFWHNWVEPGKSREDAWFLMPELPLNRSAEERRKILADVRASGLRTAAVFYDAIPWKMRSIYPVHFSSAHREFMLELSGYDLVLPISAYSREDLVDFLGAELPRPQSLDDKVITVQLPGEFIESTRIEDVRVRDNGPVRILSVGTVEPRKNHETLLQAFDQACRSSNVDLHLTLAGRSVDVEPELAERVRTFIAGRSTVAWEENADDARLAELHHQCDFTVYPSVEEGFGLPILESLWYGRPCVCAEFGAMREVADGGGCLMVDVRDATALGNAISLLATDVNLRKQLTHEAATRPFKSWRDYALEVAFRMSQWHSEVDRVFDVLAVERERVATMNVAPRPKLSVCISTYNRAGWLAVSLRNWVEQYPDPVPGVELVVCDNSSTDNTPQVVEPYLNRSDLRYKRNPKNVGMLGNLRETAHFANGDYIWIIGDDDLLLPGAVQRVMNGIQANPGIALIYLNYAYTREDDPCKVGDFTQFFSAATPIVPPEENRLGPIHQICARNENFFTAIYTLVFRRDHALRAYSQDTSGRPFSTMLTCIPTTSYVLRHMMDEPGLWIGAPQLVVNLNVSWIRYAPLWILERIPEMYELAERRGVPQVEMDRWRRHTLAGISHYFQEIFNNDPLGNSEYFSVARLVRRFKHLPEFNEHMPALRECYTRAQAGGHPAAAKPVSRVFA